MAGIRVTSTGDVRVTSTGDRCVVDPTFGVVETGHIAPLGLRAIIPGPHIAPLGMRVAAGQSHIALIGMRVWVEQSHIAPARLDVDLGHVGPLGMRVWVQSSHTGATRLDVDASHTAPWGMYVGITHIGLITSTLLRSHIAELSLRVDADGSHIALIDLLDHVKVSAEHTALIRLPVAGEHSAPLDLRAVIEVEHTALFDLLAYILVSAEHSAPISLPVDFGHSALLAARATLEQDHIAPIGDFIFVENGHLALFDLLDYVPASASHRAVWSLLSPQVDLQTGVPSLAIDNTTVNILSASIHADESSQFWQAEIILADAGDYGRFTIDKQFTLTFQGIDFALLTDTRELIRNVDAQGVAQVQASISALSISALYASPRADTLTQTWTTAIMAQDAAEQALGASIQWDMIDWLIPAYRLAVTDADPLSVAQQIVQAAGGLLESLPNGTLRARPRYPVTIPAIPDATPDYTLTDHEINGVSESGTIQRVINRIRIVDAEAAVQDRLEYEQDDDNGRKGIVRAYPSPWRPVQITHTHTSPPVRLFRTGEVSRQETQTIEIVAGVGRVQYPIQAINSLTWIKENLGGVTFSAGASDLFTATPGYSLLLVTYTTRAIEYRAESLIDTDAQLLLEEI